MVNRALVAALIMIAGCQSMSEFAPATDPDASTPDADPFACLGTELLNICIMPASLSELTISEAMTIDTDNPQMCTATGRYCVVAATTLRVNATLRATGAKPLVLLARDAILVNQLIDVGSHRLPAEFVGAGADPVACLAGAQPSTSGGGAGGSFAGAGGNGGSGGAGAAGGLPARATTPITAFRGGCAGQDGNGAGKGTGGHGGGAVYLIAGNRIDITGPGINAVGEGGTGGAVIANSPSGGGGGGSGGMIGLDAPTITCTGLILANGGGGGQGSGTSNTGAAGSDPTGIGAAGGGTGGSVFGGTGGNGSFGAAGGSGANGSIALSVGAGGGGGGGAAGIVKARATADLGAQLSPLATP
jgi:hypothetical protein